jgi:hypothetical protein
MLGESSRSLGACITSDKVIHLLFWRVSEDGRWITVGTRTLTVDIFVINDYGGKPDTRSHLGGRAQNFSRARKLLVLYTFVSCFDDEFSAAIN